MRAFVMKALVLAVLLDLICLVLCESEREERILAVEAICGLLTDYFAKTCPKVDLLTFGVHGGFAETTANDLMRRMPEGISAQLRTSSSANGYETSTILLFDDDETFRQFNQSLPTFVSKQGIWHKHLVYAPGLTPDDVITAFLEDIAINEVGFLTNNNGRSIDLVTSFLFTPLGCHLNQIRTINTFTGKARRWEKSRFYPDKYKTFYGCNIEVIFSKDLTNMFSNEIFYLIAEQLSFRMTKVEMTYEQFTNLDLNEVMTEAIVLQNNFNGQQTFSSPVFIDHLTFLVPIGEPLTDLERMFAAFDDETWIAIGVTFAIGLVVILVIKLMPKYVQNFVFGRNIRTPILNMVSIFLNGAQPKKPGRNFARYLLTLFMLWSLIFRTCYQSMTFENLNKDMRHPRVKTVDELMEKNFTALCYGWEHVWVKQYIPR